MSLLSYARGFESIAAKDDFDIVLEHCHWNYTIELLLGSEPKSTRVYFLFPVKQKKLDTFLEKNLHTRWICPSRSSIVALVFFIKKKNSSLQLVQDYQSLNSIMVKNKYSLPLIFELIA